MDSSRRAPAPPAGRRRQRSARFALVGVAALITTLFAACTETPPPPPPVNWRFQGNTVRVLDVQDETCVIVCVNTSDEPYLYQIAFRVKIGEPGSAQTWVVKGAETPSISKNGSRTLTGSQRATVNFGNIQPLDVVNALTPGNKLEVFGTYTWAAESDLINSLAPGADEVARLFRNALNSTVAGSQLPNGDAGGLVDNILNLLFRNAGSAFKLLVSNVPCLGLCDDVLGGAVYLGIGVNGTLGQIVDGALATAVVPPMTLAGNNSVPPNIQGGGFYTLTGGRTFTQTFSGADGRHTYTFGTSQY